MIEQLKEIYDRLKFYCEFHGLDFLNISETEAIINLSYIIESGN